MKKHLIAAGVVAALAAPAMAQNVSVYGILDVNISSIDTDSSTTATGGADTTVGRNSIATSRLGFRGTEDLGGGLKAEFQLEGAIANDEGGVGGTNATPFFNRESWLGLAGGFGALRVGLTDTTDQDNIDSKVSQGGNLGLLADNATKDQKNSIRYTTPTYAGFSAQLGYANNSEASGVETTADKVTSIYLQYEQGALGVYAGQSSKKITNSYNQDATTVGVKYNFGPVAVGAAYQSTDNAAQADTNTGFNEFIISASMPLGNGLTLHGFYETYEREGTGAEANNFDQLTVALTKALSKRTSAYAAVQSVDYESTGRDKAGVILGVVHSF